MSLHETAPTLEVAPVPKKRGLELRRQPVVVVGGLPTVSLLPRELRDAARGRSLRRALIGGVVAAALVAGGATAGAAVLAAGAQSRLADATTASQSLLMQVAKFKDVQALQQDIALGKAAVQVGSSTEVDWQAQVDAVEQDMPSGYTVTSVTADSASPIEAYPQGGSPLDMPRAASMQLTAKTSDVTGLPRWLRLLRSIPAYADAIASVTSDGSGTYSIQLTVDLSQKALLNAGKDAK